MDKTFEEVSRTDPEFGASLKKWKFLLYSSVKKVAAIQHVSEIDTFQEFLVPLAKINSMQSIPLYRYKNKVYEITKEDGFNVRLKSSRYNVKGVNVVWARRERIEPVKKASLPSLVYRKIQQQASVMVRSVFTKKNGYEVVSTEQGSVKMRNGEYGEKYKKIEKNNVIKKYSEISMDKPVGVDGESTLQDILADEKAPHIEDNYIRKEIKEKILNRISDPAQKVFKFLCEDPESTDRDLRRYLKFSKRKLEYAKREIQIAYKLVTKTHYRSVYAPYVIYKEHYYYLDREDGENVIIRLADVRKHVHKSKVHIEKEMAYRTPFHFTASMVA
jgi:hypothetical protein